MLNSPPPGYNTNAINSQTNAMLSVPGPQGDVAQGYVNPYKSSFSTPSSYAVPSSVDAPHPWYSQPQQGLGQHPMVQALRGN